MQLSKHYVQQLRFIQQQKFTLHSSVNILKKNYNSYIMRLESYNSSDPSARRSVRVSRRSLPVIIHNVDIL